MISILITDIAKNRIFDIINNKNPILRIFVKGSGCAGFKYCYEILDDTKNISKNDIILEIDNIKLIIDEFSKQYLDGAEIDYIMELQNSRLEIKNPNIKSHCGCGNSFVL